MTACMKTDIFGVNTYLFHCPSENPNDHLLSHRENKPYFWGFFKKGASDVYVHGSLNP